MLGIIGQSWRFDTLPVGNLSEKKYTFPEMTSEFPRISEMLFLSPATGLPFVTKILLKVTIFIIMSLWLLFYSKSLQKQIFFGKSKEKKKEYFPILFIVFVRNKLLFWLILKGIGGEKIFIFMKNK